MEDEIRKVRRERWESCFEDWAIFSYRSNVSDSIDSGSSRLLGLKTVSTVHRCLPSTLFLSIFFKASEEVRDTKHRILKNSDSSVQREMRAQVCEQTLQPVNKSSNRGLILCRWRLQCPRRLHKQGIFELHFKEQAGDYHTEKRGQHSRQKAQVQRHQGVNTHTHTHSYNHSVQLNIGFGRKIGKR